MIKTLVNTSKKYEILIESGILDSCGKYIKEVKKPCRAMVVCDENVEKLYFERVKNSLEKNGFEVLKHTFPAGEKSKCIAEFAKILEHCASEALTRDDLIIALGGGVCGDLAGFSASCYLRGISLVQIPTTYLACVDSSVGGKTAVDLKSGKNLAGTFYQPLVVITDPGTFETLDSVNYCCGAAEAVKCGIIGDEKLFEMFAEGKGDKTGEIVAACTRLKSRIVEEDEFDNGARQLLNLGHTFGHAIEQKSGFETPHGIAVAIGCAMAARAAASLGICERETALRIIEVLKKNGLPAETEFSAEELSGAALKDKKRRGDSITFVLPEKIGKCGLYKKNVSEIENIFERGLSDI